jgi:hypothetical protein
VLEGLVDREEVLDLVQQVRVHVVEISDVRPHGILERHAEDLLVRALLVAHPEQPDRTGGDPASRERRLAHEHQRVERVPVAREGALDEAVVRRVLHRAEQHAVEHDDAGHGVHLVLVA